MNKLHSLVEQISGALRATLVPVVYNALFFSRATYEANRAVNETKTIHLVTVFVFLKYKFQ